MENENDEKVMAILIIFNGGVGHVVPHFFLQTYAFLCVCSVHCCLVVVVNKQKKMLFVDFLWVFMKNR